VRIEKKNEMEKNRETERACNTMGREKNRKKEEARV
jgi:hypothetical protein